MKKVVVLLLIMSLAAFSAVAQDQQGSVSQEAQDTAQQAQDTAQAAGNQAEQAVNDAADQTQQAVNNAANETQQAANQVLGLNDELQQPGRIKMTTIIGFTVYDSNGQDIGEVQNVVVAPDGTLPYAVVDISQFGFDPNLLVPFKGLQFGNAPAGENGVTLTADLNQVQDVNAAPYLSDGTLGDGFGWDANARDFWNGIFNNSDFIQIDTQQGNRAYLASDLLDYEFVNTNDEEVGDVADIVVNVGQQQVAYVAMTSGGFLGIGEELFAVPMKDIQNVNLDEETLIVNVGEDTIDAAAGFPEDNWPADANPAWNKLGQGQQQSQSGQDQSSQNQQQSQSSSQ